MGFLADYLTYAGVSEVPRTYHRWCGLACLAAAASDHVWVEKMPGERLVPNIYVFLIGPSGIGKGAAIGQAYRLLTASGVATLRGKVTAAYLADYFKKHPKVLLVTPELALSVGRGPLADDLVKLLTELYTGGDYEFHEGTRTHGMVLFRGHCLNWLAGTTREWLRDSIPKDAVEGGFFARCAPVEARYDLAYRVAQPTAPPNATALASGLVAHLQAVATTNGRMYWTQDAERVLDEWYLHRPEPVDETLIPTWKREHDLVIKLSMLLSLSDDAQGSVIEAGHVAAAQALTADAMNVVPALVEYVSLTRETEGLRVVREHIRRAGMLQHTVLVRAMARIGITIDKIETFVTTLREGGLIQVIPGPVGSKFYVWTARHVGFTKEEQNGSGRGDKQQLSDGEVEHSSRDDVDDQLQ